MKVIKDLLNDDVYKRVLDKFSDNGPFYYGMDYETTIYYHEKDELIYDGPRALGKYISAIQHQHITLDEVPERYRTKEFYANTFYYTYDYIKEHIDEFDKEFFKDLMMTYDKSLIFDRNCFEIMPLEYIDEEMVTLAILCNNDWSAYKWLLSVNKRKKETISEDVWKLAARVYGGRNFEELLNIVPEKYKDDEFYQELFKCRYHLGNRCDGRDRFFSLFGKNEDQTVLMDYIPQEIITPKFVSSLILDSPKNISRFNEKALEMEIPFKEDGKPRLEKAWKIALKLDGDVISELDLNDERIAYFKSLYDKDSIEYYSFKFHYRDYLRSKKEKKKEKTNDLTLVALDALLYSMEGEDPYKAVENEEKRRKEERKNSVDILPVFYQNEVPSKYCKEYDSEEYLLKAYEKLGIEIIDDSDYYLYKVSLPEGLSIKHDDYGGKVVDSEGKKLIVFYDDNKLYDRRVYVTYINPNILEDKIVKQKKLKNEAKK